MIGHEFDVAISRDEDRRIILTLQGDVNAGAAARLETAHTPIDEAGGEAVVLDFRQVEYINSTGIALIVTLLAKARAADREVVAYGLSDHYRQIFEITRVSDFMGIYPDQQSALRAAHS